MLITKKLKIKNFNKYIQEANRSNIFTNYGYAVQLLEERARYMLKIDESKAIIATSSGTAALHAAVNVYDCENINVQDFTFPCNIQGPLNNAIIVDMHDSANIALDKDADLIVITNCFGHLQDVVFIEEFAEAHDIVTIYDNAATPFSFINSTNSCNIGDAAIISLHHTKHLGFGEGGLLIIDKQFEDLARDIINFAKHSDPFLGNNYKMSEIAAAGVLQWWDSFSIESLKNSLLDRYFYLYEMAKKYAELFPNVADDYSFLPANLPIIIEDQYIRKDAEKLGVKYYKPLLGLPNSSKLYENIVCLPITGNINAKNSNSNWLRRIFS